MKRRSIFMLIFVSMVFLVPGQAFAQRKIIEYPSRIKSRQGYSYYRYFRKVVGYPSSGNPYNRSVKRRAINPYQYAARGNPAGYAQNFNPPRRQVVEEELIEEFRTHGAPSGSRTEFGSSRIDALEKEVSEIKALVIELSRKIPSSSRAGLSEAEEEKTEKLEKELRELKKLLEEFRKRK